MFIAKYDVSVGYEGSTISFKAGDKASKVIGEAFPHLFDNLLVDESSVVEAVVAVEAVEAVEAPKVEVETVEEDETVEVETEEEDETVEAVEAPKVEVKKGKRG